MLSSGVRASGRYRWLLVSGASHHPMVEISHFPNWLRIQPADGSFRPRLSDERWPPDRLMKVRMIGWQYRSLN